MRKNLLMACAIALMCTMGMAANAQPVDPPGYVAKASTLNEPATALVALAPVSVTDNYTISRDATTAPEMYAASAPKPKPGKPAGKGGKKTKIAAGGGSTSGAERLPIG